MLAAGRGALTACCARGGVVRVRRWGRGVEGGGAAALVLNVYTHCLTGACGRAAHGECCEGACCMIAVSVNDNTARYRRDA